MFICIICERKFKSKRSLTSHKNHHNKIYKSKSMAGALSSQSKATTISKKKSLIEKWKKIAEYNKYPKLCKECKNIICYKKRDNTFCCKSCSGKFNSNSPVRQSSKFKKDKNLKISKSLKGRPKKIIIPKSCIVCDELHFKKSKTCSDKCHRKNLSNKTKLAYKEGRHKGNLYRVRSNPSYMEKSFDLWLKENYNNTYYKEYSVPCYKDGEFLKTFYLDFYFPDKNLAIELDGSHHLKQKEYDIERDYYISNFLNIQILRISHKEYQTKEKIDLVKKLLKIYGVDSR